jgi:peroxiredoxin
MIAPDFTLKDEEGVERSLSDYLGKKNTVLAFYPKDFTGG